MRCEFVQMIENLVRKDKREITFFDFFVNKHHHKALIRPLLASLSNHADWC
jgi:hypothetical protein